MTIRPNPYLPTAYQRVFPKEKEMPIVRVEMWPGRTHEQKQELAKAITDAVVNIGKAPAEATFVIFEDVPKENWAQAGTLASDE